MKADLPQEFCEMFVEEIYKSQPHCFFSKLHLLQYRVFHYRRTSKVVPHIYESGERASRQALDTL